MTKIKKVQKILRVVSAIVFLFVIVIGAISLYKAGYLLIILKMMFIIFGLFGIVLGLGQFISGITRNIGDDFDASLTKEELQIGAILLFSGIVLILIGYFFMGGI